MDPMMIIKALLGGKKDAKNGQAASGMTPTATPDQPVVGQSKIGGVLSEKGNFFDNVSHALMGKPDADLSPEELKARTQRRAAASAMATGAAENPGESQMGIPTAGGGFGLEDLTKAIGGLFGGKTKLK